MPKIYRNLLSDVENNCMLYVNILLELSYFIHLEIVSKTEQL